MKRARPTWLPSALGLVAALACAPAAPATPAQSIAKEPGSRLLERCEFARQVLETGKRGNVSKAQYSAAQTCIAFVDGFIWGHGWAVWRTNRDMYYCPPEEFSVAQAVPAVVQYLRAHPERLDTDSHVLIFAALSYAFPCQPMPKRSEEESASRQAR
jgi:hypothetical protein